MNSQKPLQISISQMIYEVYIVLILKKIDWARKQTVIRELFTDFETLAVVNMWSKSPGAWLTKTDPW